MKSWESECVALNFNTGELQKVISPIYFQGVNFEQAQKALVKSNMPCLRLTGNYLLDEFLEVIPEGQDEQREDSNITQIVDAYDNIIDPKVLTKNMTIDDFIDWLDLASSVEDILAAMKIFKREGFLKHYRLMLGYIRHKYNYDGDIE